MWNIYRIVRDEGLKLIANSTHVSRSTLLQPQLLPVLLKIAAGLPAPHLARLYSVLHETDKGVFFKKCKSVRVIVLGTSCGFPHISNSPCLVSRSPWRACWPTLMTSPPAATPPQAQCYSTSLEVFLLLEGFLFLRLFFGASAVSHLASLSSHRDPQGWRLHPLLCQQNLSSESHSLAIHLLLFQAFSSTPSTFIFLSANSQVEDTAGLFVNLIFK